MPNTDKEFWNDANVIDFAYSVRHNENFKDGIALSKGTIDELAKEFKRAKEKIDCEILSFKSQWSDKIYDAADLEKIRHDYKIHSVKRLSDGEVFTIGDTINVYRNSGNKGERKIINFYLDKQQNNKLMIEHDGSVSNLNQIGKVKKQLFTTEDNVDIFEGDKVALLSIDRWLISYPLNAPTSPFFGEAHSQYKYFSTKEAANEYVLMNKPCLSVNGIKTVLNFLPFQTDQLKQLVQKKINGI